MGHGPDEMYLVTGGSGFIGAALVKSLLARNRRVRVLDNFSRGTIERLEDVRQQVELVEGDIRDLADVRRAVRGVKVVCHLAYVNGTRYFYEKPAHVLDVAVKGMVNILDASIEAGVKEFILASSSEVYQTPPAYPTDESVALSVPDPLNPRYSYGGGKIICELMAINYGRTNFDRVMVFRPHNVFGPNMGWEHVVPQFVSRLTAAKRTHGDEAIPFQIQGNGRESRAFIYIDDFTDGLMRVIESGEHLNIYNIGTTEEIQMGELAHKVASCLDMKIEVVPGPAAAGGTSRRCPNIGKIKALGFEPKIPFDEGLANTVKWYAAHPQ